MSDFDHGPLQSYEVTWASGHVETIEAHHVILPMPRSAFAPFIDSDEPRRVMFHGEIDGRWRLLLAADVKDIRTIRNLSHTEVER